ncbi:hypothetical protein BDD12DRAFT_736637 [Trichophaea hybrida]|nr:hypothetical protein BDD12DRAFT_736637 [Trichophaea hybrida]
MTVSHRISIRWPPSPATEPTSTIVLTSPSRRFVDLRLTLPPAQSLYWGFSGNSSYPTPTTGKWTHTIDSRSDIPGVDEGTLEVLENGNVLERGEMVDFDAPGEGRKVYEEVWRDEVLEGEERMAVVLETEGGCVVRVGGWCQGILKTGGKVVVERWRWGERVFGGEDGERVCADEVWEWEGEREGSWWLGRR